MREAKKNPRKKERRERERERENERERERFARKSEEKRANESHCVFT